MVCQGFHTVNRKESYLSILCNLQREAISFLSFINFSQLMSLQDSVISAVLLVLNLYLHQDEELLCRSLQCCALTHPSCSDVWSLGRQAKVWWSDKALYTLLTTRGGWTVSCLLRVWACCWVLLFAGCVLWFILELPTCRLLGKTKVVVCDLCLKDTSGFFKASFAHHFILLINRKAAQKHHQRRPAKS